MAPTTSAPVLVTGATGYIGANVVLELLQHGYRVRGTVRSQRKFDQLAALPDFAKYRDRFEAAVVPDLVTGDFSQSVEGVEVVIHTASPCALNVPEDPERDLLVPAVEGTKNIARAAIKAGTVRNLVVLSSICAVLSFDEPTPFPEPAPRTFTEEDWNQATYEDAINSKVPAFAYAASKKFAEKAAYEIVKESGSSIKLVTLCPPLVFGPYCHVVDKLENLNETSKLLWHCVSGKWGKDLRPTVVAHAVDVRTLAAAHRLAFENNQEGRLLLNAGLYDWAYVVDIARKYFPQQTKETPEPKDSHRVIDNPKLLKLDDTRCKDLLGLEHRPLEETFRDAIGQFFKDQAEGK
ncbi:hypothetical protein CF327_g1667 [Tilletia walkeri]|uniref:NAD-dependent epimerase/dehydratase domain-containing protein n=1 Tax=Tilletia walkeri TaxID=117179 RepID=A0A8X7N765_9BASI|nr:hypothetical protein CF327_g1667 [Tilletia walkeri]KAE8267249.1 hypothetical protein A4X09_0g5092 [Tilletia walkeri]